MSARSATARLTRRVRSGPRDLGSSGTPRHVGVTRARVATPPLRAITMLSRSALVLGSPQALARTGFRPRPLAGRALPPGGLPERSQTNVQFPELEFHTFVSEVWPTACLGAVRVRERISTRRVSRDCKTRLVRPKGSSSRADQPAPTVRGSATSPGCGLSGRSHGARAGGRPTLVRAAHRRVARARWWNARRRRALPHVHG
jgi:hypothetical protein